MKRSISVRFSAAFCLAAMLCTIFAISAAAQGAPGLHVIKELKHDTSLPLAELQRLTPVPAFQFTPRLLKVLPLPPVERALQYQGPDLALQHEQLPQVAATIGLNIDGLGNGEYGFNMQAAPPDTEGTVGLTQYVQWVNLEFAVFDKSTGALVSGPFEGNTIWAGFGGVCQTNNDGDPIVQYDKINNRWIFTQLMIASTPYTQCVAVSTTSDATGTYNRYAFAFGNNFNDYPKMGVWTDAYYMTFNMFLNGQSFEGADACALQSSAMMAGTSAKIICFQQSSNIGGMLPGDLDGTIQPAVGEPEFFVNYGTNSLRLWKFHVDFVTPSNSTFTGPTTLTVNSFSPLGSVPQPGTSQRLDSLSDRIMYRAPYRKFADGHEALLVSHSVVGGERWYELRDPNGTPTVYQQGTFGPDSNFRWMGSIAMDQSGDIGLGYSVSSTSVFPSVFFTGRVPSDSLGNMETEQAIVNGTGSQNGGLSRWGDYSDMSVDPVDDCTFWYTQEYMKTTGSFNWNTRIANFKFANCGGQGGGPAVTLVPTSLKWGKVLVGVKSGTKKVTLTNTGNATLNISSIVPSGDFALAPVPPKKVCGSTVAAGKSCVIKVTFTPTQKGLRTGNVTITDNAPDSPQSVALSGTGK
ncbi:MAG: choice-of-anchor D domain-containing protein [Terriglobales bacterium]